MLPMTSASAKGFAPPRALPRGIAWLAACYLAGHAFGQTEAAPAELGADAVVADAPEETAPAADDVAANEAYLASTIAALGRNTLQVAEAYIGLADAQRKSGEHEDAAESYLAAVEVYRSVDGPFTPLAIAPLTRLGDNYHEARDDLRAVSAYSEARNVNRRVYGLHNPEQVDLLDRLSRSLLDLNDLAEADSQQLEALRIVQRSYPPDSDEVLAAIYKYAEWLGERSLFQLERDQYMRALRIIKKTHGDEDIRLVTPLLGIGNTYRQERNPAGMGLSSLQDALALLSAQREPNPLAIAETLRDIGDWTIAFSRVGGGDGNEYRRAYDLLGELPNGDELRMQWFGSANYVLYEPISPRGLSTDAEALDGHVIARFDVDTAGNSSNVTIVESDPAGFKDEAVLRHIRRSRFRPLMSDGRLVPGKDLAIQFKFRYEKDALAVAQNETR
jgi:TonB family protein